MRTIGLTLMMEKIRSFMMSGTFLQSQIKLMLKETLSSTIVASEYVLDVAAKNGMREANNEHNASRNGRVRVSGWTT